MTIQLPFWIPLHTFLAKNQNSIKNIFLVAYICGFVLMGFGFFLFRVNLDIYVMAAQLANKLGTISLLLFLLTLLPGILQRLQIIVLISASVVLFRRQIGILMYICALLHSLYLSTIPLIMSGEFGLKSLTTHELYGFIAILILFPVWITSNDFSQRTLGIFWKTVQRLTYIAIIFMYLHVAAVEKSAMLLIVGVFLLEIISWLKTWFSKRQLVS